MGKCDPEECRRHELRHCCGVFCSVIITLVVLILFVVLIIYLVLRPSKPEFFLQDVSLRSLTTVVNVVPGPNASTISTDVQVTVASHNPNERVGVYYRWIVSFVSYRATQITLPTALPPSFLGHKETVVWSPVLSGAGVPVEPYIAQQLQQDCAAGYVLLHVRLDGRVQWKVGTWTSDDYRITVNCPALLSSQGPSGPTPRLALVRMTQCTVDV